MKILIRIKLVLFIALASAPAIAASPFLDAGDAALRHDIQLLADWGVIQSPVTTWPLPAAAVAMDVMNDERLSGLSADQLIVAERIRRKLRSAMRREAFTPSGSLSLATNHKSLRVYENTPRGDAELQLQAEGIGKNWAYRARFTHVVDPEDDKGDRIDGSYAALSVGNWAIGAGAQTRWWGPGWESSLILSNNARPIPGVFIQRNQSTPFESPWLSWIGHWNLVTTMGQLESNRFVPRALFFGMRLSFRPLEGLEIGLSRTAQFGGKGRPQNLETFGKLLIGQDNNGDDGTTRENEPGNQLAGYDVRYSLAGFGVPVALYTQLIGEDEAGFLPSRFIGQFGVEGWAATQRGTLRWSLEYSDTTVDFASSKPRFGSAYNNGLYQSGYRYYSRSIGHSADGDARVASAGVRYVQDSGNSMQLVLAAGELGRTAAGEGTDFADVNLYSTFKYRDIETIAVGLGVIRRESGEVTDTDFTGHLSWQRDF